MNPDLTRRLREACKGSPARIQWPHRILHEAADTIDGLAKELRSLKRRNDVLTYWLLRSYMAVRRQGWEEGPTEDEVFGSVNAILANCCVCGHNDCDCGPAMQKRKAALLKKFDRKEWRKK